ncbi:MAG: NAD(P)H-binding protein [Burkholderiaceae bacterium]
MPAPARRLLLAGATGLVGRAVLAELAARAAAGAARGPVLALLRRPPDVALQAALRAAGAEAVVAADLTHPPPLPPADDALIALGTTIAVAGSQAAFRAVDHDAVLAVAQAARQAGARRLAVVSALGANAGSAVFYNRVKGEMERDVAALGFDSLAIAQPSLLAGDRESLDQPPRAAERWTLRLLKPVQGLLPASVRPIEAATVARALLRALDEGQPGRRVLPSAELARTGR